MELSAPFAATARPRERGDSRPTRGRCGLQRRVGTGSGDAVLLRQGHHTSDGSTWLNSPHWVSKVGCWVTSPDGRSCHGLEACDLLGPHPWVPDADRNDPSSIWGLLECLPGCEHRVPRPLAPAFPGSMPCLSAMELLSEPCCRETHPQPYLWCPKEQTSPSRGPRARTCQDPSVRTCDFAFAF